MSGVYLLKLVNGKLKLAPVKTPILYDGNKKTRKTKRTKNKAR